ncbi:serine protease [Rhodovarius crocodyli]|uniref:Serine protease n=1 Tax=Rhodovarius crocodyli TaxID=1979269 RepID=A0A437M3U3_9PROT|nr:S1C family serine protease [Rhodovarius crocodyli]RVT92266.1 serine protease [Rhodovarius crocodyli]
MSDDDWEVPSALQPDPADYGFDLRAKLDAVVALKALVPPDAFSANSLGTEREGSAVLIDAKGLFLTIGYLVMESETIWLTANNGRVVQGHCLAMDTDTGFALVQSLGTLDGISPLEFGDSTALKANDAMVLGASGGISRAVAGQVASRQPFAGYWEYLLEDAVFTSPAHPHWGGTACLNMEGRLVGIGSLILQQGERGGRRLDLNMVVPIQELTPILPALLRQGRSDNPPRPWLGMLAVEEEEGVSVGSVTKGAPAEKAGLRTKDRILTVGQENVTDLVGLWRSIRALGNAGVPVPLRVERNDRVLSLTPVSADRRNFLKQPRLH